MKISINRGARGIILGLVIYLPLEPLFIKLIPLNFRSIVYLAPEIILLITFLFLVSLEIFKSGHWLKTPLDLPLMFFIFVVLCSIILNNAFTIGSLENVNSILKFIPVYFVASHLIRSETGNGKFIQKILNIILFLAIIEIALGILQKVGVSWISALLQPVSVEISGLEHSSKVLNNARELGSVYGTLGDTIHYGWFLIIALMIILAKIDVSRTSKRIFLWLFALIIIISIGFSYSRVLLVSGFIILFLNLIINMKEQKSFRLVIWFSSVLLVGIGLIFIYTQGAKFLNSVRNQQNFLQDLLNIFSEGYRKIAFKFGRLGWALETPPTVLINKPFFGFSPDMYLAYNLLYSSTHSLISSVRPIKTMEDVYWVALILYYGYFGFLAWVWILLKQFKLVIYLRRMTLPLIHRQIVKIALLFIPTIAITLFANQVLEFRIASFYFWLFLGILQGINWNFKRDLLVEHAMPQD